MRAEPINSLIDTNFTKSGRKSQIELEKEIYPIRGYNLPLKSYLFLVVKEKVNLVATNKINYVTNTQKRFKELSG